MSDRNPLLVAFLGSVLLISFVQLSYAQITIDKDNILDLKGSSRTIEVDSTGSTTVNVGVTGGPQTFDFSTVTITDPITAMFHYEDTEGTPFAASFPTANLSQSFGTTFMGSPVVVYSYFEVTDDRIVDLGSAATFGGFDIINREGDRFGVLPLTFGTTWKDTVVNIDTSIPPITTTDSTITCSSVDAWGAAQLTGGTFECLRIAQIDSSWITTEISGNITQDMTTQISYAWVSRDEFMVVVAESQENETNLNFTDASSFIRLTDSPTSVDHSSASNEVPSTFDLSQNFPNPFNPETQIRYVIGEAADVELTVFDINGRLVRTLLREAVPAGEYSASWDGTDASGKKVASGHYVYQLRANGQIKSKLMILVK